MRAVAPAGITDGTDATGVAYNPFNYNC
eukprot:COSAG02_NODE_19150_length_897_cov_1.268170_2_plen_27_part_01